MKKIEVAITGIGAISCIGNDIPQIKNSLENGLCGIINDKQRTEIGFRSPLTGQISNFDPGQYLKKRQRKRMDEYCVQAHSSSMQAIIDAGLTPDDFANTESGIVFGNDSTARSVSESIDILRDKKDTLMMGSGYIFRNMNSTVTMNLATLFGIQGANWTVSGACASGSHAIGQAVSLILSGQQERMIVGGAQEISWQSMASFDALEAFSNNSDPLKASKPFDKDRDGLIPSGGAATLIIERKDLAQKRGAKIYATILSYAFSSDGDHISKPNGSGAKICINKALKMAEISPNEIDYINAHATSTPVGDRAEATAIIDIFKDRAPYISSTKGMTGHECWMAGASEAVYTMIMMENNFIAPNINFSKGDETTSKLNIVSKKIETKITTALSNSFGFGGTNAALIFRKE